jgi:hypothetical protein
MQGSDSAPYHGPYVHFDVEDYEYILSIITLRSDERAVKLRRRIEIALGSSNKFRMPTP